MSNWIRLAAAMFVLATLVGTAPGDASAQASSFAKTTYLEHSVDILNCCAHFAFEANNSPDAGLSVSGPPWPLQPGVTDQYGSASASASTQFSRVDASGASVTATVSTTSNPSSGPSGGLRAFAAEGTGPSTYYSFTLDSASYVSLQGLVIRNHSTQDDFGVSFSLRAGSTAGPVVSGFAFSATSASQPDMNAGGLFAGPTLLGPGTYVLMGGVNTQVNGGAGFEGTSQITLSLTLDIQPGPDGPPLGEFAPCGGGITGTVTRTRPGGTPQAVAIGDPVRLGDVIETGSGAEACIELGDGRQIRIGGNSRITISDALTANLQDGGIEVSSQCGLRPYRLITWFGTIEMDECGRMIVRRKPVEAGPPDAAEVHLIDGQIGVTPWNAPPTTVFGWPITVRFDSQQTEELPLDQDGYDTVKCELFPADPACVPGVAPAITSANAATFMAGSPGTFTVTATGTPVPALSKTGALPAGVTFTDNGDGTATIGGTPAAGTAGTYPLTITAANGIAPNATQEFTLTVIAPRPLTALSPARLWVGQAGTSKQLKVDLKVDVVVNGTRVGGGALAGVASGGTLFSQANLNTVSLTLDTPTNVPPGAEITLDVWARASCAPKQQAGNSGIARLWYNGQPIDTGSPSRRDAGSRFDATIGGTNSNYFLRDALALSTTAGTSRQSTDLAVDNTQACPARNFGRFGTWKVTLP
jgi:putative Ig domain-containing protein